jgi:hypothetical protein
MIPWHPGRRGSELQTKKRRYLSPPRQDLTGLVTDINLLLSQSAVPREKPVLADHAPPGMEAKIKENDPFKEGFAS